MSNRLRICREFCCLLPSFQPIADCLFGEAGPAVMVGEHLRLVDHLLRETLHYGARDGCMYLLPFTAEQAVIRGVLNQGMLERESGVRWRASSEHQLRLLETLKCLVELVLPKRTHQGEQLVGKLPANGGPDLPPLL